MLLDAWRLSVGTLTAVPVRSPAAVDRRRAAAAMVLAPLAALPLGVAVTGVAVAGHGLHLPTLVTALLAVGAAVLGNRSFHLDGLADTVDGLAASYDRDRSLLVMRSGTSGPAGVVAIVLVVGLQVAGLASLLALPQWWEAAVLAGVLVCVSRAALVLCCTRGVPAAREDGLGRTYTQTVPPVVAVGEWLVVALVLACVGAGAGLDWWRGPLSAVVAVVVVLVLVHRATRRFGGVSGDVFGAGVELALAALLVSLSVGPS